MSLSNPIQQSAPSNEDRPSLSSFQDEANSRHSAARRQLAGDQAGPVDELAEGVGGLSVEQAAVHEDDSGRTVKERLTAPTEQELGGITALVDRTLERHHGEVVFYLSPASLASTTLSAFCDAPDPKAVAMTSPADAVVLPAPQLDLILSTLRTAGGPSVTVTLLHNPYNASGMFKSREEEQEGIKITTTASATNDEETAKRWSATRAVRVLVRRKPEGAEQLIETRVAVVGNVDAGKSSLLGVLTRGHLDDGRGKARVSLFRHKHEVETGRTSSAGNEILGFTVEGDSIMPEEHQRQQAAWEAIASKAAKVVSFTDLAGHERYLKTTLAGLTGTAPDFVLLIVGANAGLIGMSKEHLSVALALSLPVVCIVTKVDMTPANVYEQTIKQLVKILKSPGCRKKPVFVNDHGMACELAESFAAEKACPIFRVSNVTGEGLPLLKTFLNVVKPTNLAEYPVNAPFEFAATDIYSVPFVGTVLSGVILSGSVRPGDVPLLGPDSVNAFIPAPIKSIQRKRVNVDYAEAGQAVTLALKRIKRAQVRKGMVLVEKGDTPPVPTRRFEGTTLILYHQTTITTRYQAMLHLNSVRQTVQIEEILDRNAVRTGDRATLRFKFQKNAEYLHVGDRFLFREGRTKALGVVTKLLPNLKD
ncbi:hypothetical protein JCM8547_003492 [Rhodosporidiobolus lusitaniae]